MQNRNSIHWWWFSLDIASATAATVLCLFFQAGLAQAGAFSSVFAERLSVKNFLLFALFSVLWTGIHQLSGLYVEYRAMHWQSLVVRALFASAFGSIFFLLFPLFSNEHRAPFLESVLVFFAASASGSLVIRILLWPLLPKGDVAPGKHVRTLIIGSGPLASRVFRSLTTDEHGENTVLGFIDSQGSHTVPEEISPRLLGNLEQLEQILMSTPVDEALIALPMRSCYDQIQKSITICERGGVPVTYHVGHFAHQIGFSQVQERSLQTYMSLRPSRVEQSSITKRFIDMLVSSAALVCLAPVFLLIAIAVKVSSRGPVFFSQERYGLNKRRFRMFKFRTMVADAEARQASLESKNEVQGPTFKIKNDPRVTRLGQFLRKTSLDELPQLLNVLRGEMSLVGPRPLPLRDVSKFTDAWLMRRFSVKPGLTCLWQVKGRSGTTFNEWIAYDLEYIDTWTPLLDFKILLMTIPAVVRGSGAM